MAVGSVYLGDGEGRADISLIEDEVVEPMDLFMTGFMVRRPGNRIKNVVISSIIFMALVELKNLRRYRGFEFA